MERFQKKQKNAKKRLREAEKRSKEILNYIDFRYVVGGVSLLGGIVGLYFAFKRDKRERKIIKKDVISKTFKNFFFLI